MANSWDTSTLKKLKSLFDKGLSTAEIGRKLGISKNAVVGKINRLGWNNNKPATKVAVKAAPKTMKTAKATKATPVAKKTSKVDVKPKSVATKKQPVKKDSAQKKADPVATEKTKKSAVTTASKKTNKDLAVHQRIIQHSLEMANLKPNQCRWPIGDPDSEHFHFCGAQVFSGKPYCYEHCRQAYQFTPPKKK